MFLRKPRWQLLGVLSLVVIIGIVAGFVIYSQTNRVNAAAATPRQKMLIKSFDTWSYRARLATDSINTIDAHINYEVKSVEGLKTFMQLNRGLAKQLETAGVHNFEALLTFNRPISLTEFNTFSANNKLKVKNFNVRLTASNDKPWSLFGTADGANTIPIDRVNAMFDSTKQQDASLVLSGITDVQIEFDASQYQALYNFKPVFLVDITPTQVKQEVQQTLIHGDEYRIDLDMVHPYVKMEKLDLKNFQ